MTPLTLPLATIFDVASGKVSGVADKGWSRARVTDTIPLGFYMIADQVHSKFLVFLRSLYNPDLVSIGLRGVL